MIEKHQIGLYLYDATAYKRMQKSTVLTISMNPETETYDYIADESPTEELRRYKMSIDQDMTTIKSEADYELMFGYFYNLKTGSAAKSKVLIVFFEETGTLPSSFKALEAECTIVINDYDAVAGKINFSIMFGGTVKQGDAVLTLGVPAFTAAA
jgi:hypothetical protein